MKNTIMVAEHNLELRRRYTTRLPYHYLKDFSPILNVRLIWKAIDNHGKSLRDGGKSLMPGVRTSNDRVQWKELVVFLLCQSSRCFFRLWFLCSPSSPIFSYFFCPLPSPSRKRSPSYQLVSYPPPFPVFEPTLYFLATISTCTVQSNIKLWLLYFPEIKKKKIRLLLNFPARCLSFKCILPFF